MHGWVLCGIRLTEDVERWCIGEEGREEKIDRNGIGPLEQ